MGITFGRKQEGRNLKNSERRPFWIEEGKEGEVCDGGGSVRLTWKDLEMFTDNFSDDNVIDTLLFCKAYRGKTLQGQEVTVKIWGYMGLYSVCDGESLERMQRELVFLGHPSLRGHPYMPKLFGYCHEGDHCGIVYDLKSMDTLHNLIKKDTFTWRERMNVALKFASLLAFLHSHKPRYFVRSIDAAHIMLDQDSNPILIDFALLVGGIFSGYKLLHDDLPGIYGYTDDVYFYGILSQELDVFSYGVILLMLISKRVWDREDLRKLREDRVSKPLVFEWARSEYERLRNASSSECSLVDGSLKGDLGFDVLDGTKVSELGLRCVKYNDLAGRPTMAEVVKSFLSLDMSVQLGFDDVPIQIKNVSTRRSCLCIRSLFR